MSRLVVENVSKSFGPGGAVEVLQKQSMTVEEREFVALLGPSGCGKSTLLRIINGLMAPDQGTVTLGHEKVTGVPGKGRGMVFQTFDLFPWRTALENVAFGLEAAGVPKPERMDRARDYLERVGLSQFANSLPHEMSGGMQQRVGIARAFAINPKILLMDEPFGALDVQTRDVMQDQLLDIWQADQKTVIFVTHGIEEALYLADRVLVFSPRPAKVLLEMKVPFERPRQEEIRTSPEFLELRKQISEVLKHGKPH